MKDILDLTVCIITMNRTSDFHETIKSLNEQSILPKTILVLENGSRKDIIDCNSKFLKDYPFIKYFISEKNLGVAGGRNFLLKKTDTEFVVEIDDDIEFANRNALASAVSFMQKNLSIGCGAFRITNYHTQNQNKKEFPFKNKRRSTDKPGSCFWFIGAGHIFRGSSLKEVGLYKNFFPYGSEEQDLSIRLIDSGHDIFYIPSAHILHKASPVARIDNQYELGSLLLKNRLKFALYNFPLLFVFTAFLIRTPQYILRFKSFKILPKAIHDLYKERDLIKSSRKVIKFRTILKLFNLRSQLIF